MLPFRIPAENASVSEQSRLVAPRSHENNNNSNGEGPNVVSPSSYRFNAESPARSMSESPTGSTDEESFSSRPHETNTRVNETPSTETAAVQLADGKNDNNNTNNNNNEEKKLWFGLLPGDFVAAAMVVTTGLGKGAPALWSGVLCGIAYILASLRFRKQEERIANIEKNVAALQKENNHRFDRLEHLIIHGSLPHN